MKLTVSRETFLAKLGIAVRGASTRSPIQTLAGVLLRVEDGRAELEATDMELGVRVGARDRPSRRPATRSSPAACCSTSCARCRPISSRSSTAARSRTSRWSPGPAKFHLRTLPPEDFPKLPEAPGRGRHDGARAAPSWTRSPAWRGRPRATRRARTSPACSSPPAASELRMVATDSYRLAVKETQLEDALEGSLEANVPARTLQELGRIAGGGAGETIGVAALENQVVFTVDDVVLSSRLVEGRFPNYQQLLPESYEHELRVSRDELLEVVRRVGLLAQKNAPLRLRFSEGALDVSAQTPDVGEASESLPVPFAGEPLEIGFNPEFFREGLESAESEELILKLISPLRPGLIQSGDEGSASSTSSCRSA